MLDSGYSQIEAINVCGKTISDGVYAQPVYLEEVLIPNVVTANADGYNDFFFINKSLKDSNLVIVDRRERTAYEAVKSDNTWSGEDVSSGVCFFTLHNNAWILRSGVQSMF